MLIIISLLLAPILGRSQSDVLSRDSVLSLFADMRRADDSLKIIAAADLEHLFTDHYSAESNFDQELDSVPFLGQLASADRKLRMLCWNIALEDGAFRYYCVVRHRPKTGSVTVTVLKDSDTDWARLHRKPLQSGKWYGALYYRILTNRYRGRTYYTLLGWDGKDAVANRKIIDVLTVRGASIILGAGIFRKDGRPAYRLIFEYANDAVMSLNYNEKEKMIVMDHLAPEDSRLEGQYQFYGPDLSYDGLQFKKGKWTLRTDIFTKNKGLNNISEDVRPGDFTD